MVTPSLYLTSDQHHDHYKMMKYYEKRPFETTAEMDKVLVSNTLETVPEGGTLVVLGDFSMVGSSRINYYQALTKQYNKKDMTRHLVLGNHDELKPFTYVNIELFSTVHTSLWFTYKEYSLVMAHDPAVWTAVGETENVIFLHGHVHSLYRTLPGKPIFNVGVDVNNFCPLSIDEIIDTLKQEGSL